MYALACALVASWGCANDTPYNDGTCDDRCGVGTVCREGRCLSLSGDASVPDQDAAHGDVDAGATSLPDSGPGGACISGSTRVCYSGTEGTAGRGQCRSGIETCSGGIYGPCTGEIVPTAEAEETGLDEDCDGVADESGIAGAFAPAIAKLSSDYGIAYAANDSVGVRIAYFTTVDTYEGMHSGIRIPFDAGSDRGKPFFAVGQGSYSEQVISFVHRGPIGGADGLRFATFDYEGDLSGVTGTVAEGTCGPNSLWWDSSAGRFVGAFVRNPWETLRLARYDVAAGYEEVELTDLSVSDCESVMLVPRTSGGYAVVWGTRVTDPTTSYSVRFARLNADGSREGDEVELVTTDTGGSERRGAFEARIGQRNDGTFFVLVGRAGVVTAITLDASGVETRRNAMVTTMRTQLSQVFFDAEDKARGAWISAPDALNLYAITNTNLTANTALVSGTGALRPALAQEYASGNRFGVVFEQDARIQYVGYEPGMPFSPTAISPG